MKMKISRMVPWLGRMLRTSLATLLSLALTYVFYTVLDLNVFDYVSQQDGEADVVNLFYRIENSGSAANRAAAYEDGIVLFDLAGETSRSRIAGALSQLAALDPRRIIVDVIFPEASAISPIETDSLGRVVGACGDRLITACRVVDGGDVEHSFYTLPQGVDYGAANNNLFYCRAKVPLAGGGSVPSLAYAAADVEPADEQNRYVNFRSRMFPSLGFGDLDGLERDAVAGKFIVVGDSGDLRDWKDLPFPINGSRRTAGVTILLHTLATLLNDDWIIRTSGGVGWAVAAVVTLLFVMSCYWINDRTQWPPSLDSLLIRAMKLLFVGILLLSTYLIFAWFGLIVNLVYAMLSVAMSGFALDAIAYAEDRMQRWKIRKNTL